MDWDIKYNYNYIAAISLKSRRSDRTCRFCSMMFNENIAKYSSKCGLWGIFSQQCRNLDLRYKANAASSKQDGFMTASEVQTADHPG